MYIPGTPYQVPGMQCTNTKAVAVVLTVARAERVEGRRNVERALLDHDAH